MSMHSRYRRLSILLSCFLIACGGGGGSGSTSAELQTQSSSRQLNLCEQMPAQASSPVQLAPNAGRANPYQRSGNPIADLNGFTNGIRTELGLPTLSINAEISNAAAAHSSYMASNNILTHYETAGLPGFTAATPHERIDLNFTPTLSYSGEIASSMSGNGSTADNAIRALFDAPLHRIVMLSEYESMGSGYARSSTGVDYATQDYANYQPSIADFAIVAYPYANSTRITAAWENTETPNPMADTPFSRGTVGYPITLQGNFGSKLTLGQFKVYANCSSEVALTVRSHDNDPSIVQAENVLLAVPNQVLNPNTRYTVWVTGYYLSSSQSLQPFDLRWSFSTN
ncbi:CAP domain-containing protein [Chitinibacter fontanus]|uniref:CAP domain-containing protein n=1 Tax=Chitinibacter fontanus TaxID=1737446 RepID=A0A7D5ZHE2_9NEIS|nr:CAP domain-containing protein [Chitinibacter fontanus]QLI82408.1 CAP domain-containing protein [Chitinibacter fontanus]